MKQRLSTCGLLATLPLALCACSPKEPAAPVIPPTELAAVNTPPPVYPDHLGCNGIGGTTVLNVKIATNGKPADVKLRGTSGNSELDESAIKAVRDWEFEVGTRNGKPWVQTIEVPVTFNPPVEKPVRCFAIGN